MSYKTASALLGVLALGTAVNAVAAELPTIRYGQGLYGAGIGQLALTIGEQKGFFAREGVRVEIVKSAAGQPRLPSDISSVPNAQFVQNVLNGSDDIAVAAQNANPIYSLIVKPEIKSFADLKGKELTLTAPWDNITLTARELLAKHGLKPTDYTFKSIGGTEGRMACLKAGQCSAVFVGQPTDIDAIKLGFHRLGYSYETGSYVFNVEVVSRAWAQKNKDTLVRYLRGDADAMRYIRDPKNRDDVAKTLADLTHEPQDVVNEMMDNIENPKLHPLTKNAEVDMAGFRHVLALVKKFGLTSEPLPPAEHFVDLSYAKAAGIR